MIIPYHRMMGFIINSYKPLYLHLFNKDWTFTLENYVKSQIHLNVLPDLFERNVLTYHRCLEYLKGNEKYFSEFSEVVKYFYMDMSNMLCSVLKANPDTNCKIDIICDVNVNTSMEKKVLDLNKIREELEKSLEEKTERSRYAKVLVTRFSYSELYKLKANRTLTLAAIYALYGGKSEPAYLLEVIE